MIGNSTLFGDPLLNIGQSYQQSSQPIQSSDIQRLEAELKQRQQMLQQAKNQVVVNQQQSPTPVWDEIDSVVKGMTDKEFEVMATNEEFQESQAAITAILQAQYLKLMRPLVEGSTEGKDALDRHLTLVKRLKKSASKEVDNEIAEFQNYKKNYSHLSWDEYLKTQRK